MSPARLRTLSADDLLRPHEVQAETLLEQGQILVFPPGLLELPGADDLRFLREELGQRTTLKNVSYHPEGDYLSGLRGEREAHRRTCAILCAHHDSVQSLLGRLCPRYRSHWRAGKVNYRPFEEQGRNLAPHSSNELVHIDAFASGATHGGRILRFFTNVHPERARVWKSAGTFTELFVEFGGRARIAHLGSRGLTERLPDRALTGLIHLLGRAGLPQAATLDTSPYDRAMKRLHDTLKDDPAFQADGARCATFEFPPFHSWVVLTDTVSHAVVRGQHALACTWIVPLADCTAPELAPYSVLARGTA